MLDVSKLRIQKKVLITYVLLSLFLLLISIGIWIASFYFGFRPKIVNAPSSPNIVKEVTGLYPIQTQGIVTPHSIEEIQEAVKNHQRVSIGGGRYSMGGQTASKSAVQIDTREFNKIVAFSTSTKEITVQSGIRWRDIQDFIDPYDLSIQIMQTYSNFTVGGSLSVNVHGRYIGRGPVIMSVKKFSIVLADGSLVEASPDKNKDIFYSAIGGMGGIGVITEVTLQLVDNVNVERERVKMSVSEYKDYFFNNIRSNPDIIFHNGDIYPMDFEHVSAVSWKKTDKPVTTESRLIPRRQDYWLEKAAWVIMSEWPFGKKIREYILEPILYSKEAVHTRNYEASYDVAELEPESRKDSTYVLQEYFVPVERFDEFIPKMKEVFVENKVNLSNVSIRHANKDPGAKLAWAQNEVFAFVVYYKQNTDDVSKEHVARWTREMIDQVLSVGGAYYLPYQPHATQEQFNRAYPHALEFFEIKKQYDPTNKFTNNLWDIYYRPGSVEHLRDLKTAQILASTTKDYVRFSDNMFLALPEWYIVYSAGEYASVLQGSLPSHFDYRQAVKDYWSQYDRVTDRARGTSHQNKNYNLVLKIIGWSFTLENNVKWVYENTVGKVSELLAGNTQVEEDEYAAQVARAYEQFIYDYPWYDFPYAQSFKEIGAIPKNKATYSLGEKIRKFERRMFLRLEYGAKYVYASVIRVATHSKFGVQDDMISALIKEGDKFEIITAPHYHPFTKLLLSRLEQATTSFKVLEIAGNSEITFTYIDDIGASIPEYTEEIIRDPEIQYVEGSLIKKDRITVLVNVLDIFSVYKTLREKGVKIGHFYDY